MCLCEHLVVQLLRGNGTNNKHHTQAVYNSINSLYQQWRRLHRAQGTWCPPFLPIAGQGGHPE